MNSRVESRLRAFYGSVNCMRPISPNNARGHAVFFKGGVSILGGDRGSFMGQGHGVFISPKYEILHSDNAKDTSIECHDTETM